MATHHRPPPDGRQVWSNPFGGTLLVAGLSAGGTVGELSTDEQTFPIKAGTLTKSTS